MPLQVARWHHLKHGSALVYQNYNKCLSVQSEARLPANDSQLASSLANQHNPVPCDTQSTIPAVTLGAVTAKSSMQLLLAIRKMPMCLVECL